jgi:hypothetical protein
MKPPLAKVPVSNSLVVCKGKPGGRALAVAERRFVLVLFEFFGITALVLATVGIYGIPEVADNPVS